MAEQRIRVEVGGRVLGVTNLDKVLYPVTGTTKAEVLAYYAAIAPYLLPQLRGRPVTRVRWPHGTGEASFFEKNAPVGAPSWLPVVRVGGVSYPYLHDVAALTWVANLAALELHVPQWRIGREHGGLEDRDRPLQPAAPDRLVIDLDPGAPAGLQECAQVALEVRARLAELGLTCVPVTSGSKGLHLYAALPGDLDASEVSEVARLIAEEMAGRRPDLVVATMTKARRAGKVFFDWSQNNAAKTTIAPYSLRGTGAPQVAAPRTWEEVEEGAEEAGALTQLRLTDVVTRCGELGDLAQDLLRGGTGT